MRLCLPYSPSREGARSRRALRSFPVLGLAVSALLTAGVAAQSDPQIEALRQELRQLEAKVQELKAEKATPAESVAVPAAQASDSSITFGMARTAVDDLIGIPDLDATVPDVSGTVDIRLWGRAKFDTHIDNFQNRGGFNDFQAYVTNETTGTVDFNPRDSRIGIAGTSAWDEWQARAVVEMDFYGTNAGNNLIPRMRLGYAELKHEKGLSIRAGQDWLPILQANPGTLDFGILSWAGNVWWRIPQVTARYDQDDWQLLATVFKHRNSTLQEYDERMPYLGARFEYHGLMDGKAKIALNGAFRDTAVRSGGNKFDVTSWIVGLDSKVMVTDQVALSGELWVANGAGREFLRYGLDYNANGDEIEAWGGFVAAEFKASEQIRVNTGYGIDDPKNSDVQAGGLFTAPPFQRNQALFANVKYLMSKQFGIGAEVMHLDTQQVGGANFDGQRLTFSAWYIF